MWLVVLCLASVMIGAGICFAAIAYATYRFQNQAIRKSNWADRIELYINIDRYMQDVRLYLIALSESINKDTDNSELFRRLRISTRTLYNYVNENRGEIDLFLPAKISKQVFDIQVLSNLHMASQEETEVYWDQDNIDLIANYINETICLIKKDMILY